MNIPHIPVLFEEVKENFSDIKEGYIVDCTLGYGGHTEALLEQNPNIKMICIDRDTEAIEFSKKRLAKFKDRIIYEHGCFSDVIKKYDEFDIRGILADIGVSSLQLDSKNRGFGFESDVLDMRMDTQNPLDAYEVVNRYPKDRLEEVLRDFGEIREYKKIARQICEKRKEKPFKSAKELSVFVGNLLPKKKIHPATLVFQAIRIEVNDELGELGRLLESIKNSKINKCKVAIISFHSLEDRIVKRTFKEWTKSCICPSHFFRCECSNDYALGKILTKKPIIPTKKEIKQNPRSRSSKMRIFYIDRRNGAR